MPLEDFLVVLDDLRHHVNPPTVLVNTVGGEPLVRKDIIKCGYEISRRGYAWGMVSNGYLLDSTRLRELQDAGLCTIAISLDGLEEQHNWLRGNSESFNRAVNAIQALVKGRPMMWDVITCINRKNLPQIHELKNFLISLGVNRWRCCTIFPSGRAENNPDLHLLPEELRELMDFIVETRLESRIKISYGCEGYLGPEYEGKVRDYLFNCQAGIMTASILADGNISGCLSIRSNFHQGNIYKDNFWEVWNNGFVPYRNVGWKRQGECSNCPEFKYCLGNAMHLRRDDGSLMMCHYRKLKML